MSGPGFTAGEYVLGELEGDQLRAAQRRLRDDPEFAAEVKRLRPIVAELERVPADVWEGIPPLAAERAEATPEAARTPVWRRPWGLRPAFAAGLAAAAAALVLAVVIVAGSGDEEKSSLTLAAVPGSGTDASGSAELAGAGGTATVRLSGLEELDEGEFYELWMLNDADDLVSLGSFRASGGGETEVEVPVPVDPSEYAFLDISVEPDDGDASHSGASVLRGPIRSS